MGVSARITKCHILLAQLLTVSQYLLTTDMTHNCPHSTPCTCAPAQGTRHTSRAPTAAINPFRARSRLLHGVSEALLRCLPLSHGPDPRGLCGRSHTSPQRSRSAPGSTRLCCLSLPMRRSIQAYLRCVNQTDLRPYTSLPARTHTRPCQQLGRTTTAACASCRCPAPSAAQERPRLLSLWH